MQKIDYVSLHYWIKRNYGQSMICEFCKKEFNKTSQIHWANKSGKYQRNREDWMRLCVKCHKKYDKEISKFKNNIIIVFGAAGSIGRALSKKIAEKQPKKLLLLDQDESGLFEIYEEIKEEYKNIDLQFILVDIRNKLDIESVFEKFLPDIVYFCSAYKHVALLEKFPSEAIKTNILGTLNVMKSAVDFYTKKFIFISTDKAVNPSCIMGLTKQVGEEIALGFNNTKTKFIIVRFGNVIASRGSVVPIFKKKIEESKNLPITHPSMKRYFMGIYEAVELILKASELGKGGEIFIFDMGSEVYIKDLAQQMIKISGKDLSLVYTKPNPGEKFEEVLMTKEEQKKAKKIGNLWKIN